MLLNRFCRFQSDFQVDLTQCCGIVSAAVVILGNRIRDVMARRREYRKEETGMGWADGVPEAVKYINELGGKVDWPPSPALK